APERRFSNTGFSARSGEAVGEKFVQPKIANSAGELPSRRCRSELARMNDVVQRHDRWTITRAVADISFDVPKSVGSMVQKRWDILSEDDGHTLEYASIDGEEFTSSAEDLTMLRTLMFVVVVA